MAEHHPLTCVNNRVNNRVNGTGSAIASGSGSATVNGRDNGRVNGSGRVNVRVIAYRRRSTTPSYAFLSETSPTRLTQKKGLRPTRGGKLY